ncbi:HAD-IA family hydrolase [Stakelama marina]|uniref:phosphoglycolate phosphatase n=1 Tax=Stakelama marina TaxID=2826939 RepID=A0A8T4IG40_9SPHN|nr:HAD-IA family hydrolase [Stakelama marina]MBR0553958.1 HAD-IA family hydrolase [Stakelama marina]
MTRIPFDIVGFDLDGTILDTSGDLTAAVNHTLQAAGRPPLDKAAVTSKVGGGAKNLLIQALEDTGGCPPDEFRRLYKLLLGYYEANIAVHTRPFDGALDAIDLLREAGVTTAIVTNKFENLAEKVLGELDIRDRFACVIGGDTMGKGFAKPHRAPIDEMIRRCGGGRTAFVGDSIYDVEAAKNAGVPAIAVSFGFLLQPVDEMGADAVIDHYRELPGALRTL